MRTLTQVILQIARFSMRFPRLVIVSFLVFGVLGFAVMPLITISPSILSRMGPYYPITNLTISHSELFGDDEALFVVVELPECEGEVRVRLISGLADELEQMPLVRRIRYRTADPDDSAGRERLVTNFLLGMEISEQERLRLACTPQGLRDAFQRNVNRLWLTSSPNLQARILEDPLELSQLVRERMAKRVRSGQMRDPYLLFSSPDRLMHIMQVTPDFHHTNVIQTRQFLKDLTSTVARNLSEQLDSLPEAPQAWKKGVKWHLTGKMAFTDESYGIFLSTISQILFISVALVIGFLVLVYRSLWSALILFVPIAAGVGPNYGVIYLAIAQVNPLVLASSGVIFGLGTDYGVHLWSSLSDHLKEGTTPDQAVAAVYRHVGPPIVVGALTNILAFLCLCLSPQSGIYQFGAIGASGLLLTLVSTLCLFPAIVKILSRFGHKRYPRMRVTFGSFSGLFKRRPGLIATASVLVIGCSLIFASRVTYERDMVKVFFAKDMNTLTVAESVRHRYHMDFTQPTLLSFDVNDIDRGLDVQRRLDAMLETLMQRDQEIAVFDSVSSLLSPHAVRKRNITFLGGIVGQWPDLETTLQELTARSDLSAHARFALKRSFDTTGRVFREAGTNNEDSTLSPQTVKECSRYVMRVGDKYRFVTRVVYSDAARDPMRMRRNEGRLREAVEGVPVKVDVCGPRLSMEEVSANLPYEILRLGIYVFVAVLIFFFALFRHPVYVVLSLIPMAGAFAITLGVMGAFHIGLLLTAMAVAPLLFGLGMDNGVHVVMGSLQDNGGSVIKTMERVTRPIMFTSVANILGFVAMISSRHYAMEFLGWAMVLGMASAVVLTLTTLPAILLLLEQRKGWSMFHRKVLP